MRDLHHNDSLVLSLPLASPLDQTIVEINQYLLQTHPLLQDTLLSAALDGGVHLFEHSVVALPVFRTGEMSGYHYSYQNKMLASLRFGLSENGYFVIQTQVSSPEPRIQTAYYSFDGKLAFSENEMTHTLEKSGTVLMEPHCPILNHLYNVLSAEYALAAVGRANTKRAFTIEQILRRLEKTRKNELSVNKKTKDESVLALNHKMMTIEMDPVYNWKERFQIFKEIKTERAQILRTKRRVHRKSILFYQSPILLSDAADTIHRFFKRPFNNLVGLSNRLFIEPLRWFGSMVRGNMGLAFALSFITPFTFFFISQPLNPHAMWAVGKVRAAYLNTTEEVKSFFGDSAGTATTTAITYTTTQPANPTANSSQVTVAPAIPGGSNLNAFDTTNNGYSLWKPATGGLLMMTDAPVANGQNWEERMSNFKQMEIAYEENLEIAPRLGRLEQMETQLNWPLIVESTWLEADRYLNQIDAIEAHANEYKPELLTFLAAEKARTQQIQLYLWDRNIRFILDHPYTMMDQGKDQTQMDYYVGRSFVLLRDMTQELSKRYSNLRIPQGYDAITKLADHFQGEYKSGGDIFDRLRNNSKLFAQKDPFSTTETRSYMKREWELLYLLQNKTQEASNSGLQLYNWSIRNAVFILQSVQSAKREELMQITPLFKKNAVNSSTAATVQNNAENSVRQIDSQYEALFHMMVLEYTSIRKEIGEGLKKDIEATQRRKIIENVESFLKDREVLLKGQKLL